MCINIQYLLLSFWLHSIWQSLGPSTLFANDPILFLSWLRYFIIINWVSENCSSRKPSLQGGSLIYCICYEFQVLHTPYNISRRPSWPHKGLHGQWTFPSRVPCLLSSCLQGSSGKRVSQVTGVSVNGTTHRKPHVVPDFLTVSS